MTHYLEKMTIYAVMPGYFIVSKTAYDRCSAAIYEYNHGHYLGDIISEYHISLAELNELRHLSRGSLERMFCPRARKKISKSSIIDLPPENYDLGHIAADRLHYCFMRYKHGLNQAVESEIASRHAKAQEEALKYAEATQAYTVKTAAEAEAEERLRQIERERKCWLFPELASVQRYNMD
ncbi:MAG: hypothetical protein LBI17_00795 [Rickettsiales bacterium]|nr:hypothetical protein [Rickettsiales bacterium]